MAIDYLADECRDCGKPYAEADRVLPEVDGGLGMRWGGLTGKWVCGECH